MKLGDFEIYALSDGTFGLDGGQMFGVVPKVLWEKKLPADQRNRIRLGLTCLLVEQDAAIALEITRRCYVFRTGTVVTEGPSEELRRSPLVEEIYFGTEEARPC